MEELGIYENDKTFGDTYNHHYDMVGDDAVTQIKKIDHIRLWFRYFCNEVEQNDANSNFAQTQAPNSGRAAKGLGPYGVFPGFVDSNGKVIKEEEADLYHQLMYEISESAFYCEDRMSKGYYALEKFEETEKMEIVKAEADKQNAAWAALLKNEMDDRRLSMGFFKRYNISQKEFESWALGPIQRYNDALANEANEETFEFCGNFADQKKEFNDRLIHITNKF